jgi:hypothetical protein
MLFYFSGFKLPEPGLDIKEVHISASRSELLERPKAEIGSDFEAVCKSDEVLSDEYTTTALHDYFGRRLPAAQILKVAPYQDG